MTLGTATRRPSRFDSFALPDEILAGRLVSPRGGATITIIAFSLPATLTGAEEKKTGPSRFRLLFFQGAGLTRISQIGTNSEVRSQGRNVPSAKFQV
jgi:hypothetical protein